MTVSPTVANLSSADAGVMLNAAGREAGAYAAQKGGQFGWQEIFAQVLGGGTAVNTTNGKTKTPAGVAEFCADAIGPQVVALEDCVVKPGASSMPAMVRGSGVEASQREPAVTSGAGYVAETIKKESSSTVETAARMPLEVAVMGSLREAKASISPGAKTSTSGAKARGASPGDSGNDAPKVADTREGSDDLAAMTVGVPVSVPVVHLGPMPANAGVESGKADDADEAGGVVKGLLAAPEVGAAMPNAHVVRGERLLPTKPGQNGTPQEPPQEYASVMDVSAEKPPVAGAIEIRPAEQSTIPIERKETYAAVASGEPGAVVREDAQQQPMGVPTAAQTLNRETTTAELEPEKPVENAAAPRVEKRGRVAEMQVQDFARETGARVEFTTQNAPQSETTQPSVHQRIVYAAAPSSTANAEVRDAFGAIDRVTTAPAPTWIHAGAHRAEAGFLDPALGWVSVRAETHGGTVQASLIPGTNLAAAELGGHLQALNAHLAQSGTDANVLMGSLDAGAGRGQQHGGREQAQSLNAEQGAQQPPSGQSGRQSVEQPVIAARAIGSGNLISVVA